ncbi:hypothetical protein ACTWPB_11060 [Nocardia sp. IBHARD005]|uniref:hypothetical protein n=1 Tax=Nocardia sp. IBHARD005 TaxID=3457765 RepID=UPI004058B675
MTAGETGCAERVVRSLNEGDHCGVREFVADGQNFGRSAEITKRAGGLPVISGVASVTVTATLIVPIVAADLRDASSVATYVLFGLMYLASAFVTVFFHDPGRDRRNRLAGHRFRARTSGPVAKFWPPCEKPQ